MFSVSPCSVASAGVGIAELAPRALAQRVGVRVVPEPEGPRDAGAHRRGAVLGVVGRDDERHGLAPVEEAAVGRGRVDTVGATLPTVMVVVVMPRLPSGSVTRSRAV